MQSTLNEWYLLIQSVISGMFSIYIVDGVSLGWFLVTVAVFAIIIDILFRKVIS